MTNTGNTEASMTNTNHETAEQAWETYVGEQSPAEFAHYCEPTVGDGVMEYVNGCELTAELTTEQRIRVAALLLAHIDDD